MVELRALLREQQGAAREGERRVLPGTRRVSVVKRVGNGGFLLVAEGDGEQRTAGGVEYHDYERAENMRGFGRVQCTLVEEAWEAQVNNLLRCEA